MTSWTLVIHQDKISKDVRGTHAMVSRQPKAIGTRKSREADDGQAPKGVGLVLRLRDPAEYSCRVATAKGREPLGDCGNDRWSIKPLQDMQDINAASH